MDPAPQPTQPSADDLLTLSEVRDLCRIGRTTCYRWRNEHGLRVIRILGIARVRRRDLDAFLERH
jgi:predicted DNA-binding transcriptional regulator AlpA